MRSDVSPLVSIVIPTLNRARLLKVALRSAIEQTYQAVEILVSDDSSEDNTAEVVAEVRDDRVRYVMTPRRLNMNESFEFALDSTQGEYLTFLTDDSYMLPYCISRAIDAVRGSDTELASWRHAGYFDADWVEPMRRNTLYVPRASHRSSVFESRQSLRKWFKNYRRYSTYIPRSINSLCHRSIVERARAVQGTFFLPPAPDHSSAVGMLMNSDKYVFIDDALVIDGVARESIGPSQSFTLSQSSQDFYRSLGTELNGVTFLGLPTVASIVAQSFDNVRGYYGNDCPPLDAAHFLGEIVEGLEKLSTYGADVDAFHAAALQRVSSMMRFRLRLRRALALVKWRLIRMLRENPVLYRLESLRGLSIYPGSQYGFSDMQGAARLLIKLGRN